MDSQEQIENQENSNPNWVKKMRTYEDPEDPLLKEFDKEQENNDSDDEPSDEDDATSSEEEVSDIKFPKENAADLL